MSFEEREGKAGSDKAKILTAEFKHVFKNLLIAFHPDIPGEVKGKSANTAWGAKIAKQELIDKQKKILIMPRLLLMMLMLYYTRNIFLT